jgi:hypothetical protein
MSKWREMTHGGDRDRGDKWRGSACDGYGERSDPSMERAGANKGDGYDAGEGEGWGRPHPLESGEVDRMSDAGRRVDQYRGGDSTKHGPGFASRPWGKD